MNTFKVGLLVISTIVAIVVMSIKITSNQSGFGSYVEYRSILSDASGIFPKTPIKVAGIAVGRIVDIELQGKNALVRFEVLSKVKVTRGSVLVIRTVGLLGDKYLEIKIGSSKEVLKELSLIATEEAGGIKTILTDIKDIIYNSRKIVLEIKDTVLPEGKKPPLKAIIGNIEDITHDIKDIIEENREKVDNTIDNIEEAIANFADMMDKNQNDSFASDVKRSLANVERLTSDLKEIVRDVRNGRGSLGRIVAQEDLADDLKQTLSGVNKIVNKVNAIKAELSVFAGYTDGSNNGGETNANLTIYPSPERYYVLGISTSDFGVTKEKHIYTTTSGTTTEEIKKERTKGQYLFNAEIGRKFHNWSIHGGLIESSGGFGFDYQFSQGKYKVGMDIFDLGHDDGANLRISNEIRLWNVVYGKLNIEKLTQSKKDTTISAGIRFNDEDLKGLLGFFL